MSQFHISTDNPNVKVGGGGTLGSGETHSEDARGPFIIFPNTTTDSNISPHAVLAYSELKEIEKALEKLTYEDEKAIDLPDSEVEEVPVI